MALRPSLPPRLTTLPGASQRRRALAVTALAAGVFCLRPFSPLQVLPG